MGAENLNNESTLQPLSDSEGALALELAINEKIKFVGQSEKGTIVTLFPEGMDHETKTISGSLHNPPPGLVSGQTVLLSFSIVDNKYLFKGKLIIESDNSYRLSELSKFYCLQRRHNERTKIPNEYYILFKLTHINHRPVKAFGSLADISTGGIKVVLKGENQKIYRGDKVKAVLTFRGRPPEVIEFVVRHHRLNKENDVLVQTFGGSFLPANSPKVALQINSILMDIYREIIQFIGE